MPHLRFGAHMPTAGGLHKALTGGYDAGCDAVRSSPPRRASGNRRRRLPDGIRAFRRAAEKTGIYPLIAHDSYLINLAAREDALLEKSRQAFLEEMRRAEALGQTTS